MAPFESLGAFSYSPSIAIMAVSLAVSDIFIVKYWHDLEIGVRSRSRSLKMVPFDTSYTTYYCLLLSIALYCTMSSYYFDVE